MRFEASVIHLLNCHFLRMFLSLRLVFFFFFIYFLLFLFSVIIFDPYDLSRACLLAGRVKSEV